MSVTFGAQKFASPSTPSTTTTAPVTTLPAAMPTTLQFNLSATPAATTVGDGKSAATMPKVGLFALPVTSAPASTTLTFSSAPTTTTATSTGFTLGTKPATTSLAATSTIGVTSSAPAPSFSLGGLTSSAPLTLTTPAIIPSLPTTGTMTFAQLEDTINKWTVDLEEQGKIYGNQAKQLNTWDRLLISNGEKIVNVSNSIERVKQQQLQLDNELDFVLAQQNELEDCITPLEKEYENSPVTDLDRDKTYKLAENIDVQMKQMSEDLKEIIEHLNESNKSQELSDPVAQVGKILNAHMNSLQWIDHNIAKIGEQLDDIAKLHDINRRNHENLHGA